MAFMTRSCWNILRVNLARRNQRPEGGEVSEIIQAHGSATGGAWLCSSIRPFLHSNFYRLFGTRRNGVDQAWSNGMAVILLTVGVFTCWMCITKDGGHDDLLRAFCEVSFFKVFPPFPFLISMATGNPGLGAVLCLFVLHTFLSACALGSAVWIFRNIPC